MEEKAREKDSEVERILIEAIDTYGMRNQVTMFFEESAELQDLLAKKLRGREVDTKDIQEEIADVLIVLFQLMFIFGHDDVLRQFDYKLKRLEKRVQKEREQCESD